MNVNVDEVDKSILRQTQKRMTMLALNLQRILTPMEAAGVLAGAAVGILTTTFGRDRAAEYLTELAVEINVLNQNSPPARPN